jgi:DNA-binding NarL/FixJ family response regulator
MTRIGIIDTDEEYGRALYRWLGTLGLYNTVGRWRTVDSALERLAWSQPELVIVGHRSDDMNGTPGWLRIRELGLSIKILLLSDDFRYDTARQMIEKGVNGYLLKGEASASIACAIKEILSYGFPVLHGQARF